MAKPDRSYMFGFIGTFKNVTMVNSTAYGKHYRAARGTYKKAKLNDALLKSSELQAVCNGYAKPIKDALDPYRRDFYEGQLWMRLLSFFRRQLKKNNKVQWSDLGGFNLYYKYPLTKIIHLAINHTITGKKERTLNISASLRSALNREKAKADGNLVTLIVLFAEPGGKTITATAERLQPLDETTPQIFDATFPIPPKASVVIVALKSNFCKNRVPLGFLARTGMLIAFAEELVTSD